MKGAIGETVKQEKKAEQRAVFRKATRIVQKHSKGKGENKSKEKRLMGIVWAGLFGGHLERSTDISVLIMDDIWHCTEYQSLSMEPS